MSLLCRVGFLPACRTNRNGTDHGLFGAGAELEKGLAHTYTYLNLAEILGS